MRLDLAVIHQLQLTGENHHHGAKQRALQGVTLGEKGFGYGGTLIPSPSTLYTSPQMTKFMGRRRHAPAQGQGNNHALQTYRIPQFREFLGRQHPDVARIGVPLGLLTNPFIATLKKPHLQRCLTRWYRGGGLHSGAQEVIGCKPLGFRAASRVREEGKREGK
jgi:hypothetical protein